MMDNAKILPGTWRGTTPDLIRGGGGAEGVGFDPSVSASRCHLPVPGRI